MRRLAFATMLICLHTLCWSAEADTPATRREAAERYANASELIALAAFYGSPEGKSSMAKFGVYMADVMPMIEAEMKHAVEASQADKAKTPGT